MRFLVLGAAMRAFGSDDYACWLGRAIENMHRLRNARRIMYLELPRRPRPPLRQRRLQPRILRIWWSIVRFIMRQTVRQ